MPKHLAPVPLGERPRLDDDAAAPPDWVPSRSELKGATADLLERLGALQEELYADGRRALLVVLQGRDASGKDGVIRKVFGAFNPQGCQVSAFRAPNDLERRHDFLWRVHAVAPPRGMVGIFNRSHYEDVLAVRVRKLAPDETWQARYAHINAFEKLLADEGTVVVKFCLHVSRAEQRERLLERLDDPSKNWKFRPEDLDDRALWDEYTLAYRDALTRCSTASAPWFVVPADDKKTRDWLVADTLVRTLDALDLRTPVVDAATVAEWRARMTNEA